MTPSKVASLAQWLEHWSRKPGVEGSTPSRGLQKSFWIRFRSDHNFRTPTLHGEISEGFGRMTPSKVASLAQWSEHWSRKPGVEGSTPSRGLQKSFWIRFRFDHSFRRPRMHGEMSDGFGRMTLSTVASLAQWLEHWSRKPGVEGSTPSRG